MSTPVPDLIITAQKKSGERVLIFRAVRSDKKRFVPLSQRVENALAAWRGQLPTKYTNFHNIVATLDDGINTNPWVKVDKAVRLLENLGYELLTNLGVSNNTLRSLGELFQSAFPDAWHGRTQPSCIELRFTKHDRDLLYLPIEILPLLRTHPRTTVENLPALEQELTRFPGFATIIVRHIIKQHEPYRKLQRYADGKVPIKLIRNEEFYRYNTTLENASEVLWLKRADHTFKAEPLWPDDQIMEEEATNRLATCLLDPRQTFNPQESPRLFGDQIQHISCHYDHDSNGNGWFTLRKAEGAITQLKVSLATLGGLLGEKVSQAANRQPSTPGPFLFVNACASGAMNPQGTVSLIETLLLRVPARAILVTETLVDYPLAAAFARRVYAAMRRGVGLGEAVHRARWEFVVEKHNPFGVLYTLYGDPELSLEPAYSAATTM